MKAKNTMAMTLGLLAMLSVSVAAQCTFVDGSLSDLNLTINGIDPSSVMGHVVTVPAGGGIDLGLDTTSMANTGFILLIGPGLSCGSIPAGPVVGQLDIASPSLNSVVLDGFNPFSGLGSPALNAFAVTPFNVGFSLPLAFAGTTPIAFQAVYLDPMVGFFFRSTDAGAISFTTNYDTVYELGDDNFTMHTLLPTTPAINFGGVNYTQLFVGSNGVVSFAAGDDDFTPSTALLFAGFQTAPTVTPNPGIAMFYSDLNRLATVNGVPQYRVRENLISGDVTVSGLNQNSWTSQASVGNFHATFNSVTNDVVLDYSQTIVSPTNTDAVCVGITDGTSLAGTNVTLPAGGWAAQAPTFNSPGNGTSIGFLYGAGAALGVTSLTFSDIGTFNWVVSIL